MGTAQKGFFRILGRWLGIFVYLCQGRLPWAFGYGAYRNSYIARLIEDEEFMQTFQGSTELPEKFGMRLDERVVEYPWVVSKIKRHKERCRFLDAGSTLNHEMILRHPAIRRHDWTLLTLAPESNCFWDRGVSYIFDDIRSMPFRDGLFDAVFCISVIEHVGMDNVFYTTEKAYRENRPLDYLSAVAEIRRVLKPGGCLYLTVPFGRYEDQGWFQQFDASMLSTLISHFDPRMVNKTFFRYADRGWKLATEDQCRDLSFFNMDAGKSSQMPERKGYDADFAAAARGVACVELQK